MYFSVLPLVLTFLFDFSEIEHPENETANYFSDEESLQVVFSFVAVEPGDYSDEEIIEVNLLKFLKYHPERMCVWIFHTIHILSIFSTLKYYSL